MRSIFHLPRHVFLTRRRIRNRELVRKFEEAAKPPVCEKCGTEGFFHECPNFDK